MNAQTPITRAQAQALSDPFLVEDQEIVKAIARLADERGTPMQEIVKLAIEDYMQRHEMGSKASAKMQKFWNEHPLPLPTGLKADKRFFDALYDEL